MKNIIAVFFLFFISNLIFCQDKIFFEGYIVTNENDTIHGLLNNNSFMHLEFKDISGKKFRYNASQIKGFKIRTAIFESHIIENKGMPFFFLHQFHDKLDLYYCKGDFMEVFKGFYYKDTTIAKSNLIMVPRRKKQLIEFLQKYYKFNDSITDLIKKEDFDYFKLNDFIENNTK